MKALAQSLIADDIKFARISETLSSIGWITENISTNNLSVICALMGIEITDLISDWYYQAISKNMDIDSIFDWFDEMSI